MQRYSTIIIAMSMTFGGGVGCVSAADQPGRAPAAVRELDRALMRGAARDAAIRILIEASQGHDAALRCNAIEAMQPLPDRALPLTQRGLGDANAAVRFAAVVTAGMLKFNTLSQAIGPLMTDANPSVRAAAIYAMHTMGERVDLTPLGDMLVSQDAGLRANVAMLLGLIGDKSAIPMLKQTAGVPMPRVDAARAAVVRCQVAEAVVRLGDNSDLDTLRAGAYNSFGEVRVLSINAMGEVKDERMSPALRQMLNTPEEPPEVKLAAAAALARMGDQSGLSVALRFSADPNAVIRAQAAWGLGWFSAPGSVTSGHAASGGAATGSFDRLQQLIGDPSPLVRVSAAAAIIRQTVGTP